MRVSELAFVNDQAGISTPAPDRLKDLVERHDDVIEFTEIKFQSKKRTRPRARHRNYRMVQSLATLLARCSAFDVRRSAFLNHERPISISHTRAARQQQI